ncbi:MAG: hypothetical protein ACD_19C00020G0001, partial [uncultured bacterium]
GLMYKLLKRKSKSTNKEISLNANPFKDRHATMQISTWKGVAVGVDISLTDSKEYKTLLDAIYALYRKDVKVNKKQKYKKPNFL